MPLNVAAIWKLSSAWRTAWCIYARAFRLKFQEGAVFVVVSVVAIALLHLVSPPEAAPLFRKSLGALSAFGFAVLVGTMVVHLATRPLLWHLETRCTHSLVRRRAKQFGELTGPEKMMEQFGSFFGKAFFLTAPYLMFARCWGALYQLSLLVAIAAGAMAMIYATMVPLADGTPRQSCVGALVWMGLIGSALCLLAWSLGRFWREESELDALAGIFVAVAITAFLWTLAFGAHHGAAKLKVAERATVVVVATLMASVVAALAVWGQAPRGTAIASTAATLVLGIGMFSQPRPVAGIEVP